MDNATTDQATYGLLPQGVTISASLADRLSSAFGLGQPISPNISSHNNFDIHYLIAGNIQGRALAHQLLLSMG
jgi:hypothetical protein